jgi:hypothetical protein
VPGEVSELLAMLPWGVLAACLGRLLVYLGRAVVDETVRPALRSIGKCWSARIEARWTPRDCPRARSRRHDRGSTHQAARRP